MDNETLEPMQDKHKEMAALQNFRQMCNTINKGKWQMSISSLRSVYTQKVNHAYIYLEKNKQKTIKTCYHVKTSHYSGVSL